MADLNSFSRVAPGELVNRSTGVTITREWSGAWVVMIPAPGRTIYPHRYIGTRDTLADARRLGYRAVVKVREMLEADHAEALSQNGGETDGTTGDRVQG